MLEVGVSAKDTYDEVIPFQRCQGNSVVLTNTSALTGGHAYIILVKSTNGAGLFTLTSSKPFVVDSSPPGPGMVWSSERSSSEHRSYSQDIGQYPVYWSGFHDPESAWPSLGLDSALNLLKLTSSLFVYVGLRTLGLRFLHLLLPAGA
ncbi:uncharacterized protein LOC112567511 [Pomacea canaliculata]|uniref:uncharacterized protein LOC112567511 n=1 Tax=Pomacea canaliculata TaxID=400727 RepID=UPI000D72D1CA|nr:uncharacterized protein LOC112567511 [Pomacea canaliculata]